MQPFLRKVWQRKSIQRDGGKSVKGNTSIGGLEEQGTIPNVANPKSFNGSSEKVITIIDMESYMDIVG